MVSAVPPMSTPDLLPEPPLDGSLGGATVPVLVPAEVPLVEPLVVPVPGSVFERPCPAEVCSTPCSASSPASAAHPTKHTLVATTQPTLRLFSQALDVPTPRARLEPATREPRFVMRRPIAGAVPTHIGAHQLVYWAGFAISTAFSASSTAGLPRLRNVACNSPRPGERYSRHSPSSSWMSLPGSAHSQRTLSMPSVAHCTNVATPS